MTEHTPGPWKWAYDGDSKAFVTAARNSNNPCKAIYDYKLARVEDFSPEATKANARLIAAAPDLLAACERVLWALRDMNSDEFSHGADKPLRNLLAAAIARATAGDIECPSCEKSAPADGQCPHCGHVEGDRATECDE